MTSNSNIYMNQDNVEHDISPLLGPDKLVNYSPVC